MHLSRSVANLEPWNPQGRCASSERCPGSFNSTLPGTTALHGAVNVLRPVRPAVDEASEEYLCFYMVTRSGSLSGMWGEGETGEKLRHSQECPWDLLTGLFEPHVPPPAPRAPSFLAAQATKEIRLTRGLVSSPIAKRSKRSQARTDSKNFLLGVFIKRT